LRASRGGDKVGSPGGLKTRAFGGRLAAA